MTTNRTLHLFLSLFLIAAAILACSAPQATTPAPGAPSPEPATLTSEPPTATAESPTATTEPGTGTSTPRPPTATPQPPSPTPPPAATRIQFEPGDTSATVTGEVAADSVERYVLRAQAGQTLEAIVSPPDGIALSIYGADGTALKQPDDDDFAFWRGRLPATQDYFIEIIGAGAATSYHLNVIIPVRIRFEPGTTSATIEGQIEPDEIDNYVLRAMAGQTMEVDIASPDEDVLLTIYGEDGIPLKRSVSGEPYWQGTLYATQDYFIEAVAVGGETDYTLSVSVSPLSSEPTRIQFEPGATSATVEDSLAPEAFHRYVLRAQMGQGMYVTLSPPDGDAVVGIEGADGQTLVSPLESSGFAVVSSLPRTQDYIINVVSFGSSTPYTLKVSVPPPGTRPPRIQFGPGDISATVTGNLSPGGEHASYVLRAMAGQEMVVDVSPAAVGLWIEGEDGSSWQSPFFEESLTVRLPATQDYFITVLTPPGAGPTSYALDVTITTP